MLGILDRSEPHQEFQLLHFMFKLYMLDVKSLLTISYETKWHRNSRIFVWRHFILMSHWYIWHNYSFIYFLYLYCLFLMTFFASHAKRWSVHTPQAQITVVLQSICEWGTCSTSISLSNLNCLSASPRYKPTALTNQPPYLKTIMGEHWATCPSLLCNGLR